MKERPKTPEEFFRKYSLSVDHDGVMADTRSYVVQKVNEVFEAQGRKVECTFLSVILHGFREISWERKRRMTNDEQSNDEVRRIKKIISQSDIYLLHFVIRLFVVRHSSFVIFFKHPRSYYLNIKQGYH